MLGVPVYAYETEAAFAADDKQNGSLLMMYESITCKVHEAFKDGKDADRRSAGHGAAHARPHRGRRELHYAGRRVYGRYADGLLRRAVRPANRQQCRAARVSEKLVALPGNPDICGGHGPVPTLEDEKRRNPYL